MAPSRTLRVATDRGGELPLRVLLVTGSFPPMTCGVGDYTHALAGALARQPEIEVGVLTSVEGTTAAPGCTMFPVVRAWTWSDRDRVRAVLASYRPDIVHFQYPTQGYRGDLAWALPLLVRAAGFPVVQTWHEHEVGRLGGWIPVGKPSLGEKLRNAIPQVAVAAAAQEVVVARPEFAGGMPGWYRLLRFHRRFTLIPLGPPIPRAVLSDGERSAVRAELGAKGKRLLAFFGFLYAHKGLEDILEIMDPSRHHLAIVGAVQETDGYQRALLERIRTPPLSGSVTVTGFLPPLEVARILAAADAVVLPFRHGSTASNTTLKAAILQGTFVLTTHKDRHGYDAERNAYFARPGDVAELRAALEDHVGTRNPSPSAAATGPDWPEIAARHVELYLRHARPPARRSAG